MRFTAACRVMLRRSAASRCAALSRPVRASVGPWSSLTCERARRARSVLPGRALCVQAGPRVDEKGVGDDPLEGEGRPSSSYRSILRHRSRVIVTSVRTGPLGVRNRRSTHRRTPQPAEILGPVWGVNVTSGGHSSPGCFSRRSKRAVRRLFCARCSANWRCRACPPSMPDFLRWCH
jgi:hypothetical protein